MTEISDKYDLPYHSVNYHRDNCLSRQLLKSVEMREASHVENIANDILSVYHRVMAILEKTERKEKVGLFLQCCSELRSYAEFLIRLEQTFRNIQAEESAKAQEAQKVAFDFSCFTLDQLKDIMRFYSGSIDSQLIGFLAWLFERQYFGCPECGAKIKAVKIPVSESQDLHGSGKQIELSLPKPRPPELQVISRRRRTELDA